MSQAVKMDRRLVFTVILATLFGCILGAQLKLPSYINSCKRSDPNLNDCIIQEGNRVIPTIVHGDKKYKIPNLSPFKVDHVLIQPSDKLKLELFKSEIFGFEDGKIVANELDFDKKFWTISVKVPSCQVVGDYKISGQILILPITGSGKSNITLEDTIIKYHMNLDIKEEDGVEHAVVKDRNTKYIAKRVYIKFENLFNGNKLLGDEMDKFLNENWKDVNEEIREAASEIVSTLASSVVNQFFKIIPFNEMFPQ